MSAETSLHIRLPLNTAAPLLLHLYSSTRNSRSRFCTCSLRHPVVLRPPPSSCAAPAESPLPGRLAIIIPLTS
ncbi:hypothetical protein VTO73DRAFT_4959 [Trametes versicolor]